MRFPLSLSAVLLGLPVLVVAQNTSLRPPITGVAQVLVYASNMAQARHFYGTFLGLPESGTTHQRYRVNANQAVEVDPLPRGVANHLEAVAFATADAEALRRYLLVQRIDVPDSVKRRADGAQWFWVKDPEGHRIEFVQLAVHARYMPVATHATEEPISSHILHAGFVVRDRAAEDHFFRDVLGFHEGWQGGMKDKQVDWVDMQVPNGTDWIEYMIHGPGPITPALSGVLNHFALGVPNMHEAMELLEQRGWHSTAREKAQIGRDGKWQLNLYDPDGTRVELMELRPVQIPCCSPYTLPAPK